MDTQRKDNESRLFKPDESSTGWETMLNAIIKAGFQITATWPLNTECVSRTVAINKNALAASIALVCRARPEDARACNARRFRDELREAIEKHLKLLREWNIAAVDLSQAMIGCGMSVFSKYSGVYETDGTEITIRPCIALINKTLDEVLGEDGELDGDTKFCAFWFEQYGFEPGEYGKAENIAKNKQAHLDNLHKAGLVESREGKVRVRFWDEFPKDWEPSRESCTWAILMGLCKAYATGLGVIGGLLYRLGGDTRGARELGLRVYRACEGFGGEREARLGRIVGVLTNNMTWEAVKEACDKAKEKAEQFNLKAEG